MSIATRWIVSCVGALVLPFVVFGGYLKLAVQRSEWGENVASLVSLAIGIAMVTLSPMPRRHKIFVSILYAVGMFVALWLFGAVYVCGAYHTCF